MIYGSAEHIVLGGCAAENPGADCVQHLVPAPLAPEQGTGPVTAHRSIKLRLLDRRTAPVSTAIRRWHKHTAERRNKWGINGVKNVMETNNMTTNILKLIVLSILSSLVGCGGSYNYCYIETKIIAADSIQEPPKVIKTKAYQAIKDTIDTVAIIAPDSCREQSAMSSSKLHEDFIRSNCGVEIGIVERGLIEAGFKVVSWEMLDSLSRGTSYLESAKELGVDVLFSINSLENIQADTSNILLRRLYYDSNEAGDKFKPMTMTEPEKEEIRNKLKIYEHIKKGSTLGAAIDVAAIEAKTGGGIWYYQASFYDSSVDITGVTSVFAGRYGDPYSWWLHKVNGLYIWELEESIKNKESSNNDDEIVKIVPSKDAVFIKNLKSAVSAFISSFTTGR